MTQPCLMRLRYDGVCAECDSRLARGTEAWWYWDAKRIVCGGCQSATANVPAVVVESAPAAAGQVEASEVSERLLTSVGGGCLGSQGG